MNKILKAIPVSSDRKLTDCLTDQEFEECFDLIKKRSTTTDEEKARITTLDNHISNCDKCNERFLDLFSERSEQSFIAQMGVLIGQKNNVSILISILNDKKRPTWTREIAADLLLKLDDNAIAQAFNTILLDEEEDEELKETVECCKFFLDKKDDAAQLLAILKDKGQDLAYRLQATILLHTILDDAIVVALKDILADETENKDLQDNVKIILGNT